MELARKEFARHIDIIAKIVDEADEAEEAR